LKAFASITFPFKIWEPLEFTLQDLRTLFFPDGSTKDAANEKEIQSYFDTYQKLKRIQIGHPHKDLKDAYMCPFGEKTKNHSM